MEHFQHDDGSLSTLEVIAFSAQLGIDEYLEKDNPTGEDDKVFYENLAKADIVYTYLASTTGEILMGLDTLALRLKNKEAAYGVFAAKPIAKKFTPLARHLGFLKFWDSILWVPFFVFIITSSWFGNGWHTVANAGVIIILLFNLISPFLLHGKFRRRYSMWMDFEALARGFRENYLEKEGINPAVVKNWQEIKGRNPRLFKT